MKRLYQSIDRLSNVSMIVLVVTLAQMVCFADASIQDRSLMEKNGNERRLLQLQPVPPNNLCTNATMIDPTVATFFSSVWDKSKSTIFDRTAVFPSTSPCSVYGERTFWYKFTNSFTTPLSVDVEVNTIDQDSIITIVRGVNCSKLQCVGLYQHNGYGAANMYDYDFVAEGLTSYYIIVEPRFAARFNVTITSRAQYFSVIDSVTDKAIHLLKEGSIDYFQEGSSSANLNLQARFTVSPESIKSVHLTYDNSKRNICDQKAPFSVFGDSNGNFNNVTMPLGRHRVTATPYTQPNCTGNAGTAIVQDFTVTGCVTEFVIQSDCSGHFVRLRPFTAKRFSTWYDLKQTKLPVRLSQLQYLVKLTMSARCGFPIQSMRTELLNATTGQVVVSETFAPKNLTVIVNREPVFSKGHFDTGSYAMRAVINNIVHHWINFTVVDGKCIAK